MGVKSLTTIDGCCNIAVSFKLFHLNDSTFKLLIVLFGDAMSLAATLSDVVLVGAVGVSTFEIFKSQ